jgi:hypothetical protein
MIYHRVLFLGVLDSIQAQKKCQFGTLDACPPHSSTISASGFPAFRIHNSVLKGGVWII